jgi:SNF2 family DNA or RNA helicase
VGEADIVIVPDSMIADPLGFRQDLWDAVENRSGASAYIDEAHRYKTVLAQRTESLIGERGLLKSIKQVSFMSGTPIPNGKPIELYPILSRFAPEVIGHRAYKSFGMRYCAGFLEHTYADHSAYNFEGRSNIDELFSNMRERFMLRIKKRDVLKDLPLRTTEMVILAEDVPPAAHALDRALIRKHSPQDLAKKAIAPDSPQATYLRLLGRAKARLAVHYIKDILDETDESALVFARHIEVVDALKKGLAKYKPLVITGSIPKDERHRLVKLFQKSGQANRVFILNQDAGGLGLTLTKANLVFQVEPSWVPGVNDQATDRADRIGQTRIVHERYLVFKNSMDRAIIEGNITKRNTTDQL